MWLFIILCTFLVLCLLWFFTKDKLMVRVGNQYLNNFWTRHEELFNFVCGVFGSMVGAVVIFMLIFLGQRNAEIQSNLGKYDALKFQVEKYDVDFVATDANLRNQALEMNNKIEEHKAYHDNWLIGMFYFEEVGNLEPLVWNGESVIYE